MRRQPGFNIECMVKWGQSTGCIRMLLQLDSAGYLNESRSRKNAVIKEHCDE